MAARRYVNPKEIKMEDRVPTDGQQVLYRIKGYKSYRRGVWNADTHSFKSFNQQGELVATTHGRYITGWLE